jgi:hypothetical protein
MLMEKKKKKLCFAGVFASFSPSDWFIFEPFHLA